MDPRDTIRAVGSASVADDPTNWSMSPVGSSWTSTSPTEPGWYWWRHSRGVSRMCEPDICYIEPADEFGHRRVFFTVNLGMDETPEKCGGEWAGPLVPPE